MASARAFRAQQPAAALAHSRQIHATGRPGRSRIFAWFVRPSSIFVGSPHAQQLMGRTVSAGAAAAAFASGPTR
jgi:hypothetical protein